MEKYARTDLACERMGTVADYEESTTVREIGDFRIRTITRRGKAPSEDGGGRYVSVECGRITMLDREQRELLARLIAGEMRGMCERLSGKRVDSEFCVFIAGLGNAELTADAIGPRTVSKLNVTRHLKAHEAELYRSIGCCTVCALSPGVLGQTGIETLEILRGIVDLVHPDAVIVLDALAARSCERLASTVQITDVGIEPGSGVGNHRSAVNAKSLSAPVIALGVPTVVDSSTLVYDALQKANIEKIDGALTEVLENGTRFFVSPKDCDLITDEIAELLSRAIGLAFAEGLAF